MMVVLKLKNCSQIRNMKNALYHADSGVIEQYKLIDYGWNLTEIIGKLTDWRRNRYSQTNKDDSCRTNYLDISLKFNVGLLLDALFA